MFLFTDDTPMWMVAAGYLRHALMAEAHNKPRSTVDAHLNSAIRAELFVVAMGGGYTFGQYRA